MPHAILRNSRRCWADEHQSFAVFAPYPQATNARPSPVQTLVPFSRQTPNRRNFPKKQAGNHALFEASSIALHEVPRQTSSDEESRAGLKIYSEAAKLFPVRLLQPAELEAIYDSWLLGALGLIALLPRLPLPAILLFGCCLVQPTICEFPTAPPLSSLLNDHRADRSAEDLSVGRSVYFVGTRATKVIGTTGTRATKVIGTTGTLANNVTGTTGARPAEQLRLSAGRSLTFKWNRTNLASNKLQFSGLDWTWLAISNRPGRTGNANPQELTLSA
ncbi:hypothetical protein BC832DRAFT_617418 [Gaertneriomyces semiglobifer]|nr:hypothetical protein BC832DRAFT_617418 [Gaertneriomyces semiglobifer]